MTWYFGYFVSDIISGVGFLANITWPWAQPLDGSISLKFFLVIRLKSEFFQVLISFLQFLVEKSWPKKNKIDNFAKNWEF